MALPPGVVMAGPRMEKCRPSLAHQSPSIASAHAGIANNVMHAAAMATVAKREVLAVFPPAQRMTPTEFWVRKMAGEPGFEPRSTESESAVLPLNYSPTGPAAS